MDTIVASFDYVLSLGAIALFFVSLIILFDLYSGNLSFASFFKKYGVACALFLVCVASALTLIYSEVFGFAPCGLCWLQRVFLYPQACILATALYIKDSKAVLYGLVLSIPGFLIAAYQHYLQIGGTELVTCPIVNTGVDCAQRTFFEFHFMTFPLMSACTFLFLMTVFWYIRKTTANSDL